MRRSWWIAALAASALSLGAASAQEEPRPRGEAALAGIERDLVSELDELARWAQGERLYGRRDLAYARLLAFEPEHADARRYLKYRRTEDGGWEQSSRYRAPRDYGRDELPEFERRHAAVVARFRDGVAGWIEAQERAPAEVDELWTRVLALDPDDERARAARGEARGEDGTWVLAETLAARERAAELDATLARLHEEVGRPAAEEPSDTERALGPEWTAVRATEHVRVLGTVDPELVETCAARAELALRYFVACCGPEAMPATGITIFALASESDGAELLAAHPRIDAARRREARRHASYWIPGTEQLAIWAADDELVLDHAVRQAVVFALVRRYRIGPERGWAFEGMGRYLTLGVTGRALSHYGPSARAAGRPAATAALDLSGPGPAPSLTSLLRAEAGAMGEAERARSLALARYLVEGRSDDVGRVLAMTGRGRVSLESLEQLLELRAERLAERLARFERERAPSGPRTRPALRATGSR